MKNDKLYNLRRNSLQSSALPQRFAGRTALVTGAAAGIGAAIAQRLAAEGARVVLVDVDGSLLEKVAGTCGHAATYHVADVSDAKQTADVFDQIVRQIGQLDAAVLNAGIEGTRAPLHEACIEHFDRVMAVNVRGVFLWLTRCMGHMQHAGAGAITITSSTSGLRATRDMGPYVTSKHAIVGLMKVAALEGASHGIRVNCVNPGPTTTRMMDAIESSKEGDFLEIRAQGMSNVPLGRYGTAYEIAALTAFLCSDEAAYCTGATYLADGGIMAGR